MSVYQIHSVRFSLNSFAYLGLGHIGSSCRSWKDPDVDNGSYQRKGQPVSDVDAPREDPVGNTSRRHPEELSYQRATGRPASWFSGREKGHFCFKLQMTHDLDFNGRSYDLKASLPLPGQNQPLDRTISFRKLYGHIDPGLRKFRVTSKFANPVGQL